MKIYPDTKIFICCLGNYYTGGPQSLYMLCSFLRSRQIDAYMFFINGFENPVHPELKKYHVPSSVIIEDKPHNIVIFSETMLDLVRNIKQARVILWWMSIDNFFYMLIERTKYLIQNRTYMLVPSIVQDIFSNRVRSNIYHITQSHYAREFLEFNRVPSKKILHELRGYISRSFYENSDKIDLESKKDIIAFNPVKGIEFTQKLIDSAPDLNFVPIQDMTPEQVQNLLARAKVYIDFGSHPGKERIPREATLSHCVVVTGRRGSADNEIDIPIPPDFKFDDSVGNDEKIIPKIVERLHEILKNFRAEHDRQNSYRAEIFVEREKFFRDASELFEISAPPPEKILRSLELSRKSRSCWIRSIRKKIVQSFSS